MYDFSKTFTGLQLQFLQDVTRVEVIIRDQDSVLTDKITFTPSQLALARGGEDGYIETVEGTKFKGFVEFFSDRNLFDPIVITDSTPAVAPLQDDYTDLTPGHIPENQVATFNPSRKEDKAFGGEIPEEAAKAALLRRQQQTHSVPEGFAPGVQKLVRERGDSYGSPAENHQLTADLWSLWMSRRLRKDVKFSAEDVCMLNALQKQSRLAFKTKDDSWFDVAGYAENVAMIRLDQRNA